MDGYLVEPAVESTHLFRPCDIKDFESMRRIIRGIDYEFKCINPSPSHLFSLGITVSEQCTVTNITSAVRRNPQDRIIIHMMLVLIEHVEEPNDVLKDLLNFAVKLAPEDALLHPWVCIEEYEKASEMFYGDCGVGIWFPRTLEEMARRAPAAWFPLNPLPPSANREKTFDDYAKSIGKESFEIPPSENLDARMKVIYPNAGGLTRNNSACQRCQRRSLYCTRHEPSCYRCLSDGIMCSYNTNPVSDDEASLTSYSSISNPFPEGTFSSGDGDRARFRFPSKLVEDSEATLTTDDNSEDDYLL